MIGQDNELISLISKKPKILSKEYASFRPDIINYFVTNVLPKSRIVFDPMSGTAPLIPHIEYFGLKAYFNDIMPIHYYINRSKTYKIYKQIKIKKQSFLEHELKFCLKPLKNKQLLVSEKWIHDDILKGLLYGWEKTNSYEKALSIFFKSIIILCVRSYSSVSISSTNATWYKPGGITTGKSLEEIIKENIEKYLRYYKFYYSAKKKIKGGNCILSIENASTIKLKNKVDTIFTSPPFANRYDYTRMYAPELYFLSKAENQIEDVYLRKFILGTNVVTDYQTEQDDLRYISACSPKTMEFLSNVANKNDEDAKNYYLKYFAKYYSNFYRLVENLLTILQRGGKLYIVVQDNIHRGELNKMDVFLLDFFSRRKLKAEVVFKELRSHQGRRNISAEHPLVLKKHYETIVRIKK